MEAASGNKYLVTILDLTRNELPFLRGLRSAAELHMRNWYAYDEHSDDVLQLYFHFPTSDVTSTLHMHVTLNRDTSPLESRESYGLDEIIEWLQQGHDDCFGLVMQHQQQGARLLLDTYCDVVEAWEKSLRDDGVAEADMPVTMTLVDVDKGWAETNDSGGRPIFTPKGDAAAAPTAEALPPTPTSAKLSPQTELAPLLEVSEELERGASSASVLSGVSTPPPGSPSSREGQSEGGQPLEAAGPSTPQVEGAAASGEGRLALAFAAGAVVGACCVVVGMRLR